MPLFEVAIVEMPTEEERKKGVMETLVFWTERPVVARNEQAAALVALKGGNVEFDASKAEVLVRPFA